MQKHNRGPVGCRNQEIGKHSLFHCLLWQGQHTTTPIISGLFIAYVGIESDSATSQDCATLLAQLFGRIAQLSGLRNFLVRLRNSQDCATLLAQLSGWHT